MLALGDMADDDQATTLDVPTVAPTVYKPTTKPTSIPTSSSGFVSLTMYNPNDGDCTAAASLIEAYTQGVCIPLYNNRGEEAMGGMWTCNGNGELIETLYTNAECAFPVDDGTFYEGCSFQADLNSYYGGYYYGYNYYASSSSSYYQDDDWDAQYYYANMPNMTYGADDVGYNFNYTPYSLKCSHNGVTDADYDLPTGTVYTLFREYASIDKTCDEAALSTYTAYSNDACIYYGNGYFLQFNGLIVNFYYDDDCATYTSFSVTLASNCVSQFDDDSSSSSAVSPSYYYGGGDNYGLSDTLNSNWFVWPTMVGAPSMTPTVQPSLPSGTVLPSFLPHFLHTHYLLRGKSR